MSRVPRKLGLLDTGGSTSTRPTSRDMDYGSMIKKKKMDASFIYKSFVYNCGAF